MTEVGGERICDIILTYCDCDREFGIKLAGRPSFCDHRLVWYRPIDAVV